MKRWEIRQVDCDLPLEDLTAPPDTDGLYLQLWQKSTPLGHLWLSRDLLPMSGGEARRLMATAITPAVGAMLFEDGFRAPLPTIAPNPARDIPPVFSKLAGLTKPLKALGTRTASPVPSSKVSVVICTRARPDSLRKCLESIVRLDPPPHEVLVVDNAPETKDTQNVVRDFPTVRYLTEPHQGLSRARNAGLRAAAGEIIAWTDDDVVVPVGWIYAIRQAFSDSSISAVTGLVLPAELETEVQIDFECNRGGFNRGYRAMLFDAQFFAEMSSRGVPVWMIGAGANMAFRREVFARVGTFDERLGAGAAGCSEDSELWYRLLAADGKILYDPRIFVWHTHRVEDSAFDRQMEQYMRGHVAALLIQHEKFGHVGNLRRLFLSLPLYYWKLCAGNLRHLRWRNPWAEIRGCLAGMIYYWRSRSETSGK